MNNLVNNINITKSAMGTYQDNKIRYLPNTKTMEENTKIVTTKNRKFLEKKSLNNSKKRITLNLYRRFRTTRKILRKFLQHTKRSTQGIAMIVKGHRQSFYF